MYIVFQNGTTIKETSLTLKIEKLMNGSYQLYETFKITPEVGKSWAMYDYTIREGGDFKASILNSRNENLISTFFSASVKSSTTSSTSTTTDTGNDPDMFYYTGTTVVFCEGVSDYGTPINESSVFNIPSTGAYTWVLVDCGKPVKTEEIIVDVWEGEGVDKFVETVRYTLDPTLDWFKFKYTFTRAGDFRLMIYNKGEKFIGEQSVTIKVK